MSHEEYQSAVYIIAMLCGAIGVFISNFVCHAVQWPQSNEANLVSYAFIQLGFTVMVTVLPGRIVRINSLLSMEMLSLKQIFVRYVSHEIRSPLNVVHAGLDILRGELESYKSLSEDVLELVEDIFSASDSAINILNDLLNYEHLDAGTFRLDLTWTRLCSDFGNRLKWTVLMAKKKNIELRIVDETELNKYLRSCDECEDLEVLECENSNSQVYLNIDSLKIDQVIRNMVTNAIKFTPTNGSIEVKMSCKSTTDVLVRNSSYHVADDAVGVFRLEVVDSGAGIAEENHKKVFGEFAQFNRNELQGGGGSGLGLWISRRIINLHQGTMGFHSNGIGKGSVFYFELPLFPSSAAAVLKSGEESPPRQLGIKPVKNTFCTSNDFRVTPVAEDVENNNHVIDFNQGSSVVGDSFHNSVQTIDCSDGTHIDQNTWNRVSNLVNRGLGEGIARMYPEHSTNSRILDYNESSTNIEYINSQIPLHTPEKHCFKILIVDDSELNRKIVKRIIDSDKESFETCIFREADDGESALEVVRAEREATGVEFDFILIDYVMLKMHGPETVAVLRRSYNYKGIIIGITGNALPADISKFILSGAHQVITKPLTKAKLLVVLNHFRDAGIA
eukprot:CAMPEP_0201113918 /NCGR_PEP_ID=MMETSP0812-20130820/78106_1 /ASSEMBLY_ACC=CAM_ASM_000668 /TAXON_ID=98059 /ORGANISM="Dinobryon sp., Strain UTEXLB2267" /LENGTH=617 /DNA_ID=CAMNT_0047377495 /DNA_START=109 /DNA_END=1962 /DNA_ORIENTATION=-